LGNLPGGDIPARAKGGYEKRIPISEPRNSVTKIPALEMPGRANYDTSLAGECLVMAQLVLRERAMKVSVSGDLGTQRTIILTSAEAYGIEIKGENRWKTFENASLSKNEPRAKERLEGFA